MLAMNSSLDAGLIASLSNAAAYGLTVDVVAATGSTNADLRARLGDLSQPFLLAAEQQSAGRGRAGRSWQVAPGESLCFSLAWRFNGSLANLSGLPLAVGVVLAEVLNARGWPVTLKWPNDLLMKGLKLGGILIETVPVRDIGMNKDAVWAVIGVGINVHQSQQLSDAVGHGIAALDTSPVDRNGLLAACADALASAMLEFDRTGLGSFTARWESLHAHAGEQVWLMEAGQVLHQGIARGIDASGRLLLDTGAGDVAIAAGDVSLRANLPEGPHAAAH